MGRPVKPMRLNYYRSMPEFHACISVLGDPAEVRISASKESFISVRDGGITLSGGTPSKINIQGMPDSIRYAGLITQQRFPLTLLPSNIFLPIPANRFNPPFRDLVKTIGTMSALATAFLG